MAPARARRAAALLPPPLVFVLPLLLPAPAAGLDCLTFEAQLQCGEPDPEFRHEEGDLPCNSYAEGAGSCVCTDGECLDPANYIRVPLDCAPPNLQDISPSARNCSTICADREPSTMWVAGVIASVAGSASTAGGLILQKIAQTRNQALPEDERPFSKGGFILAPLWIMGFTFITIVPLPFNLMAVTWAAASLVAPLTSVTLVLNQILAPFTLGEKVTRVDMLGTAVIVSGVVLATSFGTHCESSYTAADLLELYLKAPFLVAAGAALLGMLVALIVIRQWRSTMPEHITSEDVEALDSGAPTRICIAYAYMAGSLGALMQIFFKSTGELVGAGEFDHWALWLFVVLVAVIAIFQMSYLNQGMAVCNAVVFFPTYNACFIVMTTVTGMLYYEEYKLLTMRKDATVAWAFFGSGVSLVIIGVLVLTRKSTAQVLDDVVDGSSVSSESRDPSRPSSGEGVTPPDGAKRPMVNKLSLEGGPPPESMQQRRASFGTPIALTASGLLVPPRAVTPARSRSVSPARPTSQNQVRARSNTEPAPESIPGDHASAASGKARSLSDSFERFSRPPSTSDRVVRFVQPPSPLLLGSPGMQPSVGAAVPATHAAHPPQAPSAAAHAALGRPLETIPGGNTPLASLTAEDAAAFLALSAQQRERAGRLTQAELDAAISRAQTKGHLPPEPEGEEAKEPPEP